VAKYPLRVVALLYLLFLLVLPVGLIAWRTFSHGIGPFFQALSTPSAVHAIEVTLSVALWAVVCLELYRRRIFIAI